MTAAVSLPCRGVQTTPRGSWELAGVCGLCLTAGGHVPCGRLAPGGLWAEESQLFSAAPTGQQGLHRLLPTPSRSQVWAWTLVGRGKQGPGHVSALQPLRERAPLLCRLRGWGATSCAVPEAASSLGGRSHATCRAGLPGALSTVEKLSKTVETQL